MRSGNAQGGFALVAAIFLLLVLATAGVYAVRMQGVQQATTVLALQGARAYHAARSGLEWGIYRAVNGSCAASSAVPVAGTGLTGFTVTLTCQASQHREGVSPPSTIYRLVATAEYGSPGGADHVSRQLRATVSP